MSTAYIFNDCIVTLMATFDKDELQFGYYIMRGHFVNIDDNGHPFKGKEKTVSNLMARINGYLETPFNQVFSYLDQFPYTNIYPHEHQGFEVWLKNEDAEIAIVKGKR